MCMNMLSGMGYSLVAPLFPSLSKDFSLGESLMGCIISIYAIANTVITPLIPSLCKYFSRIKLLYLATFFEASCTFICVFRINRFFLRIIHGIGSAFVGWYIDLFGGLLFGEWRWIKTFFGLYWLGLSLGTSSGPLFASLFYNLGGYKLPFIALGLFLYISVYLTKILEKENINKSDEIKENPSFFNYLTNINIILIFGSFALSMISFTYFFPCLSNHFKEKLWFKHRDFESIF